MEGAAVAIIPARYSSTRLPGKPLLPLADIPMIMHVVDRALQALSVVRAIVATDDQRIADAVLSRGGEAWMTSPDAKSGTDRVAEVAQKIHVELIVNVQGDEPLIDPSTIDAAVEPLMDQPSIQISTTSEPILDVEDVFNPNVVKVVTDSSGFALYFSRSPIPYLRPSAGTSLEDSLKSNNALLTNYRKHSGLYAYRRSSLLQLAALEPSPLERLEALEQLRALENGFKIRVVPVEHRSIGVDTEQDYQRVKKMIEENRP
ncbi:MAG TPA: 3-deoxy-manno-octulosonate cytidylyltransferase [Blastocatellia bacterium]|nr:3-deoxy-manno-octulosonate cytidylyltransferase [Blastocatellia bacterium]